MKITLGAHHETLQTVFEAATTSSLNHTEVITLPILTDEQKSGLFAGLNTLNIYPEINYENTGLEISNLKDIALLRDLDILPTEKTTAQNVTPETKRQTITAAPVITDPGQAFPAPPAPPRPKTTASIKNNKNEAISSDGELTEIDIDIEAIADRFYTGLDADPAETLRLQAPYQLTPGMFPQKYVWKNKELYTKSGEHISKEQHIAILEAAKDNPAAMQTAIEIHTGLVFFTLENVLKLRAPNHLVSADDMLQAGMIGLAKAIEKVEDPASGYQSYFIEYIDGNMRNELDQNRPILHVPLHTNKEANEMRRIEKAERHNEDFQDMSQEEKLSYIATILGMNIKDVRRLSNLTVHRQTPEVFDEHNPEHTHGPWETETNTDPDANYDAVELRKTLDQALLTLSAREERIVRLRIFEDKKLDEIALEFNIGKERIRQIEAKALRKLKHPSRTHRLEPFLEDTNE